MIAGCYYMHLYCRNDLPISYARDCIPAGHHKYGEFPHTFDARNERECKAQARKNGWKFSAGDATCPRCNKEAGNE